MSSEAPLGPPVVSTSSLAPFARVAGVGAIALALLTLVGWSLHIEALVSLHPGRSVMVPNTAITLTLIGASLVLMPIRVDGFRWRRLLGQVCAALALGLALATLAEYALARDFGIDRFFAVHSAWFPNPRAPGRPAATNAVACAAFALALVVIDARPRVAAALTAAAGLVAFCGLAAHAYGAHAFFPGAGIALNTSIALALLYMGTLAARPGRGAAMLVHGEGAGSVAARRLLPAALLSPLLIGLLASIAERAGWPSSYSAFAMLAVSSAAVGGTLVLATAQKLNEVDAKRLEAQEAIARAHDIERTLRGRLEAIAAATTAVTESVAAMPETGVGAVLGAVVDQARSLTGAELAMLGVGSDPAQPFDPWIVVGPTATSASATGAAPCPLGSFGAVACEGRTVRLSGAAIDLGVPGLPGDPPVRSFLGMPIRYRGRTIANLFLANTESSRPFTDEDVLSVEVLAGRAASALEIARLYEKEATAKAWLEVVIAQLPEAVVLLDACGRIVSRNSVAEGLARTPSGEFDPFGNPIAFDLRRASGEPLPWGEHPFPRALEPDAGVTSSELSLHSRAGVDLSVLVRSAPLRNCARELVGAVVVFQDITPLKELQRTREEWIAIIAHDLRQPLGVISLVVGALERSEDPAGAARLLERIRVSTGRLSRMIDDLLDATRIEANRLQLDRSFVDIRDLVAEIVERSAAATAGHAVVVDAPSGTAVVYVDPGRVEQILSNLLSNAAKYGDPASEIRVTLARRTNEVEVAVINSGPGIAPEEQGRLFSRFYRTRTGSSGGAKGYGLGLYITKGLVEAHGGRIWVESKVGASTAFHFTLPIRASGMRLRAPQMAPIQCA